MSKRISAKAVRMVLRGPAHLTEEYASDLVAQMVQVDRNLAALREDKRKHGRTLNVSARARARVASKAGGRKRLARYDANVKRGQPGVWLPR
jgi:hypothetical protein